MKYLLFAVAAVLLGLPFYAHADSSPDIDVSPAGFWQSLDALVAQCAVRPFTEVDGVKTYGTTVSQCRDLQVTGSSAQFTLSGQVYTVSLQDSADSDGGDLDDVTIEDSSGEVIVCRHNVLAFRDVLVALVGNSVQIKEVMVAKRSPLLT